MEDHCTKEHQLGLMEASIARMEKELFNGNGGLVKSVPVLSRNVEVLTQSVNDLRTVISGLAKFTDEYQGGVKKEDEIKKSTFRVWQIVSVVIGSVVGAIAIFTFLRQFSLDDRQTTTEKQMYWKQDRSPDSATRSAIGTPMDSTALKPVWEYKIDGSNK